MRATRPTAATIPPHVRRPPPDAITAFIARWRAAGGSERANYQLFVAELAALLELPPPQPARAGRKVQVAMA